MNCFRAFRLSPSGFSQMYRRKILRLSLKDAASIPNALGATDSESLLLIDKALPYPIFVSPFQGFKFSRKNAKTF